MAVANIFLIAESGSDIPPELAQRYILFIVPMYANAYWTSDWTLEVLRWSTENDVVNGEGNGVLNPTTQATRADTNTEKLHEQVTNKSHKGGADFRSAFILAKWQN